MSIDFVPRRISKPWACAVGGPIWRKVRDGSFPRPVRVSAGRVASVKSEIEAWKRGWWRRATHMPPLAERVERNMSADATERVVLDLDSDTPEFSDDALALSFAALHAGLLRYVAGWGTWMRYADGRWQQESTLFAFDQARRVCRWAAASTNDNRLATGLTSAKTVTAVERIGAIRSPDGGHRRAMGRRPDAAQHTGGRGPICAPSFVRTIRPTA